MAFPEILSRIVSERAQKCNHRKTSRSATGAFTHCPAGELTEAQFLAQFDELEKVAPNFDAFAHAAHVNLKEGKAFCFMCGPDEESIRKAHEAIHFPYDSITEVKRVSGADMRLDPSESKAPTKTK